MRIFTLVEAPINPVSIVSKPRVALDMYVLAQGVKTGVYRVCDELFPRLASSSRLSVRYYIRRKTGPGALKYIQDRKLQGAIHHAPKNKPSQDADILLSPFGVAPSNWLRDRDVLHAHIIHDLIAINRPEFFTREAVQEVRSIMDSLGRDTVIFATSEFTKQDLLKYRDDLSPNQVRVIPLAAGDRFYACDSQEKKISVRNCYGIPEGEPYLLSLATLEIRKNLDNVIRAYLLYLERHSESRLHLVLAGGRGWKFEKIDEIMSSLAENRRKRIIFTGFVDDEDIAALYSDALCFIYLSRYEGFGLPPLEAMACGTPVICSNNSSLPEVVGDAGLMFDADDIESVVKALDNISSSERYRDKLINKGFERARQFSWDRCARIIEDTLLEAHEEFLRERSDLADISSLARRNNFFAQVYKKIMKKNRLDSK